MIEEIVRPPVRVVEAFADPAVPPTLFPARRD